MTDSNPILKHWRISYNYGGGWYSTGQGMKGCSKWIRTVQGRMYWKCSKIGQSTVNGLADWSLYYYAGCWRSSREAVTAFIENSDGWDGQEWYASSELLVKPIHRGSRLTHVPGEAAANPPKQDSQYLIYWRKPEEWGDIIYHWVRINVAGTSVSWLTSGAGNGQWSQL